MGSVRVRVLRREEGILCAMNNAIIPGSLGSIAQNTGKSIAETFLSCDVIVIVDTSGSMAAEDSRNGRSRYSVACEELASLQQNMPGKIAVLAFSDTTIFCPNGKPQYLGGGTDLAGALRFAKIADVPGMKFIVISDGEPNSESDALGIAVQYKNTIHVIFVGPEDRPHGREFLARLAKAAGGAIVTADRATNLLDKAKQLLLNA